MNKIVKQWQDKEDKVVDFSSDLAALKHQAQGVILEAEGKVTTLERDAKNYTAECRGANGAFRSIVGFARDIKAAKTARDEAVAVYVSNFGPLPVEPEATADTTSAS